MTDYVDSIMDALGMGGSDDAAEQAISGLVQVGALEPVGAAELRRVLPQRPDLRQKLMGMAQRFGFGGTGHALPSPPFAMSARETERRAPLGFREDGTGAFFFSLAAAIGATTTMRAKVSRVAHVNRLLIVPSAPGVVLTSVKVGDEEQLLDAGVPVELYSVAALTDTLPDNFSPLGPALDFIVTLFNTTAGAITGTIGTKAAAKR